jgi:hypothetical protein
MSIELLENRIAPAALFLNSKSASFSDSDGDIVTVSFSKPILTQANLASVLSDGPTPAIDLTGLGKDAKGLNLAHLSGISFSVKKGASGDGFASIASINASGIDLSSISGSKVSLGSLSVGDATVDPSTKVLSDPTPKSPALGALNVRAFGATPGAPLFINPRTASYTDTGGDIVTVSFSKAVLTPGNVAGVFVQGGDGGLQTLDLTGVGKTAAGVSLAQGANISFSLKKGLDSAGKPTVGDGFASVGAINASGLDLGTITGAKIRLGSLSVGDATMDGTTKVVSDPTPKTAPLGSLNVASFGVAGAPRWINAKTATYTDAGGDVVTVSLSKGLLTPGNVASVLVQGGDGGLQKLDLTAVGKNAAGTSLAQGANVTVAVKKATGDGMAHIGFINAQGIDLGAVSAPQSDLGRILVGDGVDAVLDNIGSPYADGIIDATPKSAAIRSLSVASMGTQGLASQGGAGDLASVFYGEVGTLAIKGDVLDASLAIRQSFSKITIGGSLVGHDQPGQGSIKAEIAANQTELNSLVLLPSQNSGSLSIGGSVTGGSASETGYISTGLFGSVRSISIGGSLNGGTGSQTGKIVTGRFGELVSLGIKGSINGGAGLESGYVEAGRQFGNISIGGGVQGGSANSSGGISSIRATGSITVGGNIQGGDISAEGVTLSKSGFLAVNFVEGRNGVLVKGSVIAGKNDTTTSVASETGAVSTYQARSVTVIGSVIGNVGLGGKVNSASILAGAESSVFAEGNIDVRGDVANSRIVCGLPVSDNFKTTYGDFSCVIGSIKIGGNLTSSDISSGVASGPNGVFGDADDYIGITQAGPNIASIASIVVKGRVSGAVAIQAQEIGKITLGGVAVALAKGRSNDDLVISGTTIRVRELAGAPE